MNEKDKEKKLSAVNSKKEVEGEIIPEEILEEMPTKIKETFAMMSSGRMFNPLADKIEPQHIDKILDIMKDENDKDYDFANKSKNFELAYIILGILLILFLVLFLAKENEELLKQILQIGISFIGGIGGGYYLKSRKDKK